MQYIKEMQHTNYSGIKFFFAITCLYLLIFDPAIPPIKIFGGAPFSILICLIYNCSIAKSKTWQLNDYWIRVITGYSLVILYVIIRIMFDGAAEPSYINTCIRSGLTLISVILFARVFYDREKVIYQIITVLMFGGIYALLAVCIPLLMDAALYVKAGDVDLSLVEYNPFRVAFFSGNGFFGIAALYFLSLIFITTCYSYNYINIKKRHFYFIFISFCIFGCLSGRVMFIAIAISLLILLFKKPKILLASIFIFSFVLILFVQILPSLGDFSFEKIMRWLFEFYYSYRDSGVATSASTQQLFDMFHLKGNVNYIFGDAAFRNGDGYYGDVDVGFLRHLYFGGCIFFIILYVVYLPLVSAKISKVTSLILVSSILILELKGNVIYDSGPVMALYFIFMLSYKDTYQYLSVAKITNRN
ncbi:hypothetical protein J4P86_000313 [Citrobacter freundii]|uniref:hypothetical protein n=1 Tax=Citrobacter freundii TaxID=546 RepID=UPI0013D6DFA4|nr:hypothetical protein [Citrobacter freundii]EKX5679215.1 hypothetical protein [Citrobacter freundii]